MVCVCIKSNCIFSFANRMQMIRFACASENYISDRAKKGGRQPNSEKRSEETKSKCRQIMHIN